MRTAIRTLAPAILATLGAAGVASPVSAQTVRETVYSFQQPATQPDRVVRAVDGRIFGTFRDLGPRGAGGVYVLTPDGVGGFDQDWFVIFDRTNGAFPTGIISGPDGAMYGTTTGGGPDEAGTVYRLDLDGTHTILHQFDGADGRAPIALSVGSDGLMYGVSRSGGALGFGTVFSISTSGLLRTIGHFTSSNNFPIDAPVLGSDGNIYMAAQKVNGQFNGGVLRVTPSGVMSVVWAFSGGGDGRFPRGIVEGPDGHLYGTTLVGTGHRGTLYRLTHTGALLVLRQFTDTRLSDGLNPNAPLFVASDGAIYGSTVNGGAFGRGTVFRFSTSGGFSVLHAFPSSNSGRPDSSLSEGWDGRLYGAYRRFGSIPGGAFQVDVSGGGVELHRFQHSTAGYHTRAALVEVAPSDFLFPTMSGGVHRFGTISRLHADGTVTTAHDFQSSDGASPHTPMVRASDGHFYGTTQDGGRFGGGTLYRVSAAGQHTVVHDFNRLVDGSRPQALTEGSDGRLYGTTEAGPSGTSGTIFRFDHVTGIQELHRFTAIACPSGALIEAPDGRFYGTATCRGNFNKGVVFSISPDGIYRIEHHFSGPEGATPGKGLALATDGNLYGVTELGGADDGGTIFRVTPGLVSVLTTMHSFSRAAPSSYRPRAALTQANDGWLYGVANSGGPLGFGGGAFRVSLDGHVEELVSFSGGTGYQTESRLLEASNGRLYATALQGGLAQSGNIYTLTPPAQVTLLDLVHTYDGTPKAAAVSTVPAGLAIDVAYSQGGVPVATPINAGLYDVTATIVEAGYSGSATGVLDIRRAPAVMTIGGLVSTYDGSPKPVHVTTSPAGLDTFITYDGSPTPPTNAGAYAVRATIKDPNYLPSQQTATLIVKKAVPTLTWLPPAPIDEGAALDGVQLNATSSVFGSFAYTPAAGTVLPVGTHVLSVLFTPADAFNYTTATASVPLDVLANTQAGDDVVVAPTTTLPDGSSTSPSLTFDSVEESGDTTITTSTSGAPPPDGFKFGNPPIYYEVQTTAVFSGQVELCFEWVEGEIRNEANTRLFHNVGGTWTDITTSLDTVNNVICGRTDSLSPFAIGEVTYTFMGFERPLLPDGSASVKQNQAGRTIPIKFQLTRLGEIATDAVAMLQVFKVLDVDTGTVDTTNLTEDSGAANDDGNLFRVEDGQYVFSLSTRGFDAPATYRIIVTLSDGESYTVDFSLR